MPVCTFTEVAWGTTMVLNRADECRQMADECRRSAAQAADDVLRVTYLDLAHRWRMMAHEAESMERKTMGPTKPIPRTAERVSALSGSWVGPRLA
jgi:hypothetical protein